MNKEVKCIRLKMQVIKLDVNMAELHYVMLSAQTCKSSGMQLLEKYDAGVRMMTDCVM